MNTSWKRFNIAHFVLFCRLPWQFTNNQRLNHLFTSFWDLSVKFCDHKKKIRTSEMRIWRFSIIAHFVFMWPPVPSCTDNWTLCHNPLNFVVLMNIRPRHKVFVTEIKRRRNEWGWVLNSWRTRGWSSASQQWMKLATVYHRVRLPGHARSHQSHQFVIRESKIFGVPSPHAHALTHVVCYW
jgi:hypothetical protein